MQRISSQSGLGPGRLLVERRYIPAISGSPPSLCTYADNHPLAWRRMRRLRRYARVFAHILTRASRCIFVPPSPRLLARVCVCMFHGEHCLLETLSKSPQCDNWLPGVLVSLLLIIVISWRKKQECLGDEIGKVCADVWEMHPNSGSTLACEEKLGGDTMGPALVQAGLLNAVCCHQAVRCLYSDS